MNTHTLLRSFWILAFFASTFYCQASHIIGGQFSYVYNGDDEYEIVLQMWRECCPSCAPVPEAMDFRIQNGNGELISANGQVSNQPINVPLTSTVVITGNSDSCLINAPNICVEYAIYQITATLPDGPETFNISSNVCCRNSTILNIQDPGGTGATFSIDLPHDLSQFPANNNSVYFPSYPEPAYACINTPFISNMSAIDEDGDSLVYGLYTPLNDNGNPLIWANGFDEANQMGGSPAMSIDPVTGTLTAFSENEGSYVLGITVSEYRDGQFLGTTYLDVQLNVTDCGEQLNITTGGAADLIEEGVYEFNSCTELFYVFDETNFGTSDPNLDIQWLGVNNGSGVIGDFSGTATNPIIIFPEAGTYEIQIIASWGTCMDTATVIFNLFPLQAAFETFVTYCTPETIGLYLYPSDTLIIDETLFVFHNNTYVDTIETALAVFPLFYELPSQDSTITLMSTTGCETSLGFDTECSTLKPEEVDLNTLELGETIGQTQTVNMTLTFASSPIDFNQLIVLANNEAIVDFEIQVLDIENRLFSISFTLTECVESDVLNIQLVESGEMQLLSEKSIVVPCFTSIENLMTPTWNTFVIGKILYIKSSEIITELYLTDINGRQLWHIDNNFSNISGQAVDSLPKGVYLVTVKIDNQFLHRKIWID